MLATSIEIRSESRALNTTPILLGVGLSLFRGGDHLRPRWMGVLIGEPLSDLITIEAAHILGKLL